MEAYPDSFSAASSEPKLLAYPAKGRSLTTARAQWLERLPNYLSSVCKLRIGSYSFRSFYGSSEPGTPPHHDSIPSNPLRPQLVASGRYYSSILPPRRRVPFIIGICVIGIALFAA